MRLEGAAMALSERHSGNTYGDTWFSEIFDKYARVNRMITPILHLHASKKQFGVTSIIDLNRCFSELNDWVQLLLLGGHKGYVTLQC